MKAKQLHCSNCGRPVPGVAVTSERADGGFAVICRGCLRELGIGDESASFSGLLKTHREEHGMK